MSDLSSRTEFLNLSSFLDQRGGGGKGTVPWGTFCLATDSSLWPVAAFCSHVIAIYHVFSWLPAYLGSENAWSHLATTEFI